MYHIPYGAVIKLRELDLIEEKEKVSGRTVPHFTIAARKWAVIDNGLANGFHWRFFKGSFLQDFRFSEKDYPFVLTISDVLIICKNRHGESIQCKTIDEGMLIVSILRAFYPGNYGDIRVEDKRVETEYQKLMKEEEILLKQEDELNKKLAAVSQRLIEIGKEPIRKNA